MMPCADGLPITVIEQEFPFALLNPATQDLGWAPAHKFEQGIRETVRWYIDHQDWVKQVLKP